MNASGAKLQFIHYTLFSPPLIPYSTPVINNRPTSFYVKNLALLSILKIRGSHPAKISHTRPEDAKNYIRRKNIRLNKQKRIGAQNRQQIQQLLARSLKIKQKRDECILSFSLYFQCRTMYILRLYINMTQTKPSYITEQ